MSNYEKDEDIVYRKPFTVDGVSKCFARQRNGVWWVEINGELVADLTRVNARSPQEDKMDFPELEDLAATGEAATDVVSDTKTFAEKVCVVGVGQAGCKLADVYYSKGYRRILLLNTTSQDMTGLECPNTLLIGKTKVGAGKNPAVGAQAARDSSEEILRAAYKAFGSDYERILVCTSGGGGTGCGATPELVPLFRKYMEEAGKVPKVGVIVCAPKKSEGEAVKRNNDELTSKLRVLVDAKQLSPLIMVANERIGKLYPNVPIFKFFDVCNQNIVGLYNVFNELAAQSSSLVTLDPADLKTILDSGILVFGMTTIVDDDPMAMAAAIEKNVSGGLLSDAVTVSGATHAGAIMVASKAKLETTPQSNLDRAFEALGRVLGGKITLQQGVYEGPDKLGTKILMYTVANARFV